MKRRLCYVISDVDTSLVMEGNIRFLDRQAYDLTTIFLAPEEPELCKTLRSDGFDVRFFKCGGKVDFPTVTGRLFRLFRGSKPDIVHTHLFNASITGLTAARFAGVKQRVNTRHHSVEAHLYHPHAVWYDRYVNALSTDIVAITEMVARVLVEKEGVPKNKVSVVHHGFDLAVFDESLARLTTVKEKYDLEGRYPVVGVVSRFIHWKGIQFVIPAFAKLLAQFPDAVLVIANAKGSYEPEVKRLLAGIPQTSYRLIPYEREILELYKSFDALVHVPIGPDYEAFGQVYVEALAMKRPSVFTLSGVARDFIEDGVNAVVVPFEDSEAVLKALVRILTDPQFADSIAMNGHESASCNFSVQKMMEGLSRVYLS